MPLRFGLAYDFRNPAQWQEPWPEVYAALLDQIEFAEELGFDSIWITEHHLADDGYTPSPVTLLAAIAARTKRVELSTDILILPLYHPVRLAEDLATVDILSNGRAMAGIGMGYRDAEYEAFGQTRKQRVRRTEEGIEVMRRAWADGPANFEGRYFNLRDANVMPKPVQRPGIPLWLGAASEPAARRAARFGMHLLPQGDRRAAYEPWVDELQELGRSPADYRIGLIKPWFIADTRDDELWAEVSQREKYRWGTYAHWIREANFAAPPPGEPAPINQNYMVGPPDQIIDSINRLREDIPLTDIISWGTPPGMHPSQVNARLERFAAEVMPHFR
jgi:probable F420-dependent oxidoreductase